jgi:hypothetical protein
MLLICLHHVRYSPREGMKSIQESRSYSDKRIRADISTTLCHILYRIGIVELDFAWRLLVDPQVARSTQQGIRYRRGGMLLGGKEQIGAGRRPPRFPLPETLGEIDLIPHRSDAQNVNSIQWDLQVPHRFCDCRQDGIVCPDPSVEVLLNDDIVVHNHFVKVCRGGRR